MLRLLYGTAMYLMAGLIRLAALWHPAARLWVTGRRGWRRELRQIPPATGPRIWFHVASLGEFEQARAVIEGLRRVRPDVDVVLTFFSPSGYTQRKLYAHARVMYLPADLPGNAETWLAGIKPDMAIFVKYDLWPGYLRAVIRQGIPAVLMSAHWSPDERFTSWSNPLASPWLKQFDRIFLQRGEFEDFFRARGYRQIEVAGDTRIDRSLQLPGESAERLPAELAGLGRFSLVAGSTWPPDEAILFEVTSGMPGRFMIVPHDVSESNIRRLLAQAPGKCIRLSAWEEDPDLKYMVIDKVGLLPYLYALGDVAYVGGGFGKGIHNTLEPMAHGLPVIFGPKYDRFPEAVDVIRIGGAFAIRDSRQLAGILDRLSDPVVRSAAGRLCSDYLAERQGAAELIIRYLSDSLPCRPS